MRFVLIGLTTFLAACAVEEEVIIEIPVEDVVEEEEIPALEQCDAADYRPLIGTEIAAALTPGDDPMLRVYGAGEIVTQEYLPQRTNIVFDGDGLIQRVYCG